MFFILTHCIFSQQILDLTTSLEPQYMLLSLYPLDIITIKIPQGLGTFFSNWKSYKGLKMDVEAENLDGNILTYRSFDSYNDLQAVVFQTRSYYLKFINDGDELMKIPLIFSKDFKLDENDFFNYYSFQLHGQNRYEHLYSNNNFTMLSSPFVISKEGFLDLWEMLLYFAFTLLFIINISGLKCPFCSRLQCCKYIYE